MGPFFARETLCMPRVWVKVLIFWGVAVAVADATAIEFISKDEIKKLEQSFLKAEAIGANDLKQIQGQALICDMYGARTRLQVERGVSLYTFKEKLNQWQNSGEQVVKTYALSRSGLVGQNEKVVDEIRRLSQGEFLSRLTLAKDQSVVLVFSQCRLSSSI